MYSTSLTPESNLQFIFFFFNDTATTEIYTLSLHDALPISSVGVLLMVDVCDARAPDYAAQCLADRKSTRLNSSHANISYAVFCLKKKKIERTDLHYASLRQASADIVCVPIDEHSDRAYSTD